MSDIAGGCESFLRHLAWCYRFDGWNMRSRLPCPASLPASPCQLTVRTRLDITRYRRLTRSGECYAPYSATQHPPPPPPSTSYLIYSLSPLPPTTTTAASIPKRPVRLHSPRVRPPATASLSFDPTNSTHVIGTSQLTHSPTTTKTKIKTGSSYGLRLSAVARTLLPQQHNTNTPPIAQRIIDSTSLAYLLAVRGRAPVRGSAVRHSTATGQPRDE